MKNYLISLNQFADFTKATERGKMRIIKQQQNPNPFRIPWYQTTKAGIRRSIHRNGDITPILDALDKLNNKNPKNNRQLTDKNVSIEALHRYIKLKLPDIFRNYQYEIIKPEIKCTFIAGVEIKIAPDAVVRFEINGKKYIGAIKIHISKNSPFDYMQSLKIATVLYKYLSEIKDGDDIIEPKLCFSLDVFGERIVAAPVKIEEALLYVEKDCEEVKTIWQKM